MSLCHVNMRSKFDSGEDCRNPPRCQICSSCYCNRAFCIHPGGHEVIDLAYLSGCYIHSDCVGTTFIHVQIFEENLDVVPSGSYGKEVITSPTSFNDLAIDYNGWSAEEKEEGQWEERSVDNYSCWWRLLHVGFSLLD